MGNTAKAIVALAAIAGIGYVIYDRVATGSWIWEKYLSAPTTKSQVAMLRSSLNAKSRELAQVKQRLSALESPAFSGSKYVVTSGAVSRGAQPTQKSQPIQPVSSSFL